MIKTKRMELVKSVLPINWTPKFRLENQTQNSDWKNQTQKQDEKEGQSHDVSPPPHLSYITY
jgi:hypothetical protein